MTLKALTATLFLVGLTATPFWRSFRRRRCGRGVQHLWPDEFAWVLSGPSRQHDSQVHGFLVSNGGFADGTLGGQRGKEGPLEWSCTNHLPAGTVVRWQVGRPRTGAWGSPRGRMDLSSDGDQIIVYLGTC